VRLGSAWVLLQQIVLDRLGLNTVLYSLVPSPEARGTERSTYAHRCPDPVRGGRPAASPTPTPAPGRIGCWPATNSGIFGAGIFGAGIFGAGIFGAGIFGAGIFGAGIFGAGIFGADTDPKALVP
jgi:hypothetical protein